jgi:nicotinamidase-related amidase
MRRRGLGVFVALSSLTVIDRLPASIPHAHTPPIAVSVPAKNAHTTNAHQTRETPRALDEILDPKHTALLVHEMVHDITARYTPEQMATLVPRLQRLVTAARQKGVRVVYMRYTKHSDDSTNSDAIRRNILSGEPDDRTTIEGTPGWEVIDALKPEPRDLVLRKYRPDAFYGTILDSVLRWNGIRTVVVAGLGISVGVVPTITSAENLGYSTVAVGDGLLSADPKRTSDALAYIGEHAIVGTHTDVIESWSRSASRPSGIVTSTPSERNSELASVVYEGREIPISTDEILNPKHTAVLVHLMQNDFISPGGACERLGCIYDSTRVKRIVPAIQQLVAAARAKNIPVVYLRRTSLPAGILPVDRRTSGLRPAEPRTPTARLGCSAT